MHSCDSNKEAPCVFVVTCKWPRDVWSAHDFRYQAPPAFLTCKKLKEPGVAWE